MENFDSFFEDEQVDNPIQFYFEWKGGLDTASFTYWDKEKEKRLNFDQLTFLMVADRNTAKGYDESNSCGIYANEVKDLRYEKMSVKSYKGGLIAEGLWSEISAKVAGRGGKFCKAVYGVLINEKKGTCAPVCIQLYGSALAPWFDGKFRKSKRLITAAKDPNEQKKGATKYYQPSFVYGQEIKDQELKAKVFEQGKLIQKFLDSKEQQRQEVIAQPNQATEQSFGELRQQFTPAPPLREKVNQAPAESDNDTDALPF